MYSPPPQPLGGSMAGVPGGLLGKGPEGGGSWAGVHKGRLGMGLRWGRQGRVLGGLLGRGEAPRRGPPPQPPPSAPPHLPPPQQFNLIKLNLTIFNLM